MSVSKQQDMYRIEYPVTKAPNVRFNTRTSPIDRIEQGDSPSIIIMTMAIDRQNAPGSIVWIDDMVSSSPTQQKRILIVQIPG